MISSNSRYADSTLATMNVDGSSRQVIQPSPSIVTTFSYISHIYSGTETIDGLAYQYFGDATKWWHIADVNPEIMDWRNLLPGTTIRIPTI